MKRTHVAFGALAAALAALPAVAEAQSNIEFPLAPTNARGNYVAPFFDGFYQNPDGTWTLSFGFMNRNDEDLVEIPLGPNNYIEPAIYDGMQPTTFPVVSYGGFGGPRERGVFSVVVPANFQGDVWWHLTSPNGFTTKVPGRLESPGAVIRGAYELSTGPQAGGAMRPSLSFTQNGEQVWGIGGVEHPQTFRTRVGQPIEVTAWVMDRAEGRNLGATNMTLWKHQGPVGGEITFQSLVPPPPAGRGGRGGAPAADPDDPDADAPAAVAGRGAGAGATGGRAAGAGTEQAAAPAGPTPVDVGESVRIPPDGPMANQARFTAAFDTPGDYVIRLRIDNFGTGGSSAGNMCCWSNGYIKVTVTE